MLPKCSPTGCALIQQFESCQRTAYRDKAGVPTIGWGHTGADVYPGLVWTQDQCDRAFAQDVGVAERAVSDLIRAPLNPNQFDALVSFTFNEGRNNLYISTLRSMLNVSNYAGAHEQFARWNKFMSAATHQLEVCPGLTRRRKLEADLFAKPMPTTET